MEIQVPAVNRQTSPSSNWSPIMVKTKYPLDMLQFLLLLLVSKLSSFGSIFSFLETSFNLFLLQYQLHLTSFPSAASLCHLATRKGQKHETTKSSGKCLTVSTFVLASRKTQVIVQASTAYRNSGSWNGANSDISKPRTWSLWCHGEKDMSADRTVKQLILFRDTAVRYLSVYPAYCYQGTTVITHIQCLTHCVYFMIFMSVQ